MGRKRKTAPRGKTGRIQGWKLHDKGTERVQDRIARFRHFGGDSGIGHETSCAGRLMLIGAFDGMEYDPATCLSSLLAYAHGYWGNYQGGPKIAAYERQDRSHDSTSDDPRGEWFEAMDARLRNAGHATRMAVHQVSVDRHFFPDEDCGFAARLINSAMKRRRLPFDGEEACDSDLAMLQLLREGVMALVGQPMRRAA